MSPEESIRRFARQRGLPLVGFARTGPLTEDWEHYQRFLAQGFHASMTWLAENADSRLDLDHEGMLLGARSVVVCALPYRRPEGPEEATGPEGSLIARYARGADYHNFFRRKLRRLADFLRGLHAHAEARPIVDTAPVLERAWARRAGLGFIGRNGCLIVPGVGSHVLLGEVLTNLELQPDVPMPSRCGDCVRCLQACPTEAFPSSHVLDARRCIAYLTIEHEGPVDEAYRSALGERLFGCDHCQDVCPYNHGSWTAATEETKHFALRAPWTELRVEDFLTVDAETFARWTQGSPLFRPGREGMARNAALVLGNRGERRHLPVLQASADNDPSATVRDAALWALRKISG